jgi:hypothetical protein
MHFHNRPIVLACFSLMICLGMLSCKKMVTVPSPINSITTGEMFSTDAQALTAMAGVYSVMVNGPISFSNGYATILGGMSADEMFLNGAGDAHILGFAPNQLLKENSYTSTVWTSAYKTIYNANSAIEGIAESESTSFTDSMRTELTAEAKFVRAYCYFYLVNLYGDVPLVLTIDFNKTRYLTRTPVVQVYDQVIQDLLDAQEGLSPDYRKSGDALKERILPTKWAATALLARVYLYKGDYAKAAEQATAVISNSLLFVLETDLNNVFKIASKEAIWQLKQGTSESLYKNGTLEGVTLMPNPFATGVTRYCLTASLLNTFETGDRRRTNWVGSNNGINYYPYKYKTGFTQGVINAAPTEYYMMLRLAEQYLIRAEAAANGAGGGVPAAIADLNVIRSRAGVTALPNTLTQAQVLTAVARERQVELFAEWGHRWLDLKRTNKAHDVLSAMSSKQPWAGDYQLLYPVPPVEIQVNPRLEQNPEY